MLPRLVTSSCCQRALQCRHIITTLVICILKWKQLQFDVHLVSLFCRWWNTIGIDTSFSSCNSFCWLKIVSEFQSKPLSFHLQFFWAVSANHVPPLLQHDNFIRLWCLFSWVGILSQHSLIWSQLIMLHQCCWGTAYIAFQYEVWGRTIDRDDMSQINVPLHTACDVNCVCYYWVPYCIALFVSGTSAMCLRLCSAVCISALCIFKTAFEAVLWSLSACVQHVASPWACSGQASLMVLTYYMSAFPSPACIPVCTHCQQVGHLASTGLWCFW